MDSAKRPWETDPRSQKVDRQLLRKKFDFHLIVWYNFKAKLANQRLIKPDVRA